MATISGRIIAYIQKRQETTLDAILDAAGKKGIDSYDVYEALSQVHKDPRIKTNGETYRYETPKKKPNPLESWYEWQKENPYPQMDETNDASHEAFSGLDYSFLFLTPDELEDWKVKHGIIRECQRRKVKYKKQSSTTSRLRKSSTGGKTTGRSMTPKSMGTGHLGV